MLLYKSSKDKEKGKLKMKKVLKIAAWLTKDKNSIISITLDTSKAYFSLTGNISTLATISQESISQNAIDTIQDNIEYYKNELLDSSIRELADAMAEENMDNPEDLDFTSDYAEPVIDDNAIFGFMNESFGQCDDEIKELDNRPEIKELVTLWDKYQISENVSDSIIDRVVTLLNILDDENIEDKAEKVLYDFVEND